MGVYGSSRGDNLEAFLAELDRIKARWNFPWCIWGDFNEVPYIEERNMAER